jgi:hypothetical protein
LSVLYSNYKDNLDYSNIIAAEEYILPPVYIIDNLDLTNSQAVGEHVLPFLIEIVQGFYSPVKDII